MDVWHCFPFFKVLHKVIKLKLRSDFMLYSSKEGKGATKVIRKKVIPSLPKRTIQRTNKFFHDSVMMITFLHFPCRIHHFGVRGESKFEKCTLSVKVTLFSDPPTHQLLSVKAEVNYCMTKGNDFLSFSILKNQSKTINF